jgi:ribose transport system substrate-binding protein
LPTGVATRPGDAKVMAEVGRRTCRESSLAFACCWVRQRFGRRTAWSSDCVGLVPAGTSAFWRELEAGARRTANDLQLELYTRGPSQEGSVEVQLQLIDRVIAHGCKALIIAPAERRHRYAHIRLAHRRYSPLFTLIAGSRVEGAYALVATDNFLAGQLAGQQMAERLGRGARVGVLRLRQGLQSTDERERGFLLAAQASGLQVVFDTYLGDDPQRIATTLSEQLPRLDGLFSPNGSSTRVTLGALRRLGKVGTVDFVGFDGGDLLFDAVRKDRFTRCCCSSRRPWAIMRYAWCIGP